MKKKKIKFFLRNIRSQSPGYYQQQKQIKIIIEAIEQIIARVKPLEKIIIKLKRYNKKSAEQGERNK